MENFLNEISQFSFIISLIFAVYFILNFTVKLYGRIKLGKDAKFQPTYFEKITIWLSLGYILTYMI